MNLRILKKLSKRAAPILPLLGETRELFSAEKRQNYTCIGGHDFKHWERMASVHPEPFPGVIKYQPKHGRSWVALREPSLVLKGTKMVGSMMGYYEPEWEEETAWEALCRHVGEYFTEWNEEGFVLHRELRTPTQMFQAAHDIIRETNPQANVACS